jgi:hypothetical protein
MLFAVKWMELEITMLSEINQILHVLTHLWNLNIKNDYDGDGTLLCKRGTVW